MDKTWLIVAAVLVVLGIVVFGTAMLLSSGDFGSLATIQYEENRHTVPEEFHSISLLTDTADVELILSERTDALVICYEEQKEKHSVSVENGTLVIRPVSTKKWFDHIGIFPQKTKITLQLPQKQYETVRIQTQTGDITLQQLTAVQAEFAVSTGDVTAKALHCMGDLGVTVTTGRVALQDVRCAAFRSEGSTGDARLENLVAVGSIFIKRSTGRILLSGVDCTGDLQIRVSTGKVELTDVGCANLNSHGSTGDIRLKKLIATNAITVERSTGDVILDGCDGAALTVRTDTGDVTGSVLSEKVFVVSTDTGKVQVPGSSTGGKCQITTDTGDIAITLAG